MAIDPKRETMVVEAMEQAALQALFCTLPTDVLLLTGYWPVMGSSVVLATASGERVVLLPKDEMELAAATSSARLIPYEPETLHRISTPAEALAEPLQQLMSDLKLSGKVGVVEGQATEAAPYLSLHLFGQTARELIEKAAGTGVNTVAADDVLTRLRAIKTPVEIEQIRHACRLAGVGFAAAGASIAAGRREEEVAAELQAAFDRVANHGFERGRGFFFCMSGPNSVKAAGAYARTRSRVLEAGDAVMIHANTGGDGYWTDITRNFCAGPMSAEQGRMKAAIGEAREAALGAIRPGQAAREIDRAAREVLERHGFGKAFKHATGHGVGFAAASPVALPRVHPISDDVIAEGMTFNIEPAIYLEGPGGMRHCDVVACTGDGVEVLTDF